MKIKITNPVHFWHEAFRDMEFEVCEGYDPDHSQYPVMTRFGRTWFDIEAATVIEN